MRSALAPWIRTAITATASLAWAGCVHPSPPAIRVRMWWRGGGQFETILTVPCEGALFPLSGEEGGG